MADINPSDLVDYMDVNSGKAKFWSLRHLEEEGMVEVSRLPYSIRILLENVLRNYDGHVVRGEDVEKVALWEEKQGKTEIPFMPARIVMQDFTGVPAVVDLAAMRDAMRELGGDPGKVNPLIPADLIIDHSVQVDFFGTLYALAKNMELEFDRNKERYNLLKWAQKAFSNFRVVPPGRGIIHQVNLEYLAKVVHLREFRGEPTLYPDSVLGTDSHTTMINGLGVMGWGVGGIEAEAAMLGQPYYMVLPEVIGVKLVGELPEGATPTDLVLTITEILRKRGVVGKFVEYFGPGVEKLSVPDRATIANMSPEYGATMGFFPVDEATLNFLLRTGRDPSHVELVERYTKANMLFREPGSPEPVYSDVVEVDMNQVEPSISGPSHPEDRIPLKEAKERFLKILKAYLEALGYHVETEEHAAYASEGGPSPSGESAAEGVPITLEGEEVLLKHGSVIIAAITSCTNTSNPTVMLGAGLLAKKAVERGLRTKPWVKTSLAPGSRVVTDYLRQTGLLPYLEALRFHVVGYGCTTCIGNSGPLRPEVERAVREHDLYAVSVLSGNRNFSGRIHPLSRGNFLASPPLVVAYAIAGRMDVDLTREPLAYDPNGQPVYLKDIWPTQEELKDAVERALDPELFREKYRDVFKGDERWESLQAPSGDLYSWDPRSTYIKKPPFFEGMGLEPPEPKDIRGARVLALFGDRVTTDHISPAGAIPVESPAGKYLIEHGVKPEEFNTFGSRRGNHEVMNRGCFSNVRIRNLLVEEEGGKTVYWPTGEKMWIYDAAMRYREQGTPLIVIAGKQYGTGSSRDWAAKCTALLGVKAVIAESFERIHRSNLVGMGVLPLQFMEGDSWRSLGLRGDEVYDILGIEEGLEPGKVLTVRATKPDGSVVEFKVRARLDTHVEVEYYKHGGILQYVLRRMLKS